MKSSERPNWLRGAMASLIVVPLLATHISAGEPARSMRYTPRSKEETIAWQKQLRAKLFHIMKMDDLVQSGHSIPLSPKVLSTQKMNGYTLQEIEFNSTATRRIKVIFTEPTSGKGPFPAVECIHGHGGNRRITYDPKTPYRGFATALAERGYVTIAPDVGQHVVYEPNRILMGERLWDAMRCVDYLESRPNVDKSRIGCAGLSLGGEMAMWLGAMDPRIVATLSSGFLTKMDQIEEGYGHCMCWKFPGLRDLVEFSDIYALIAPRELLCQNGLREAPHSFIVPIAREALEEIKPAYAAFHQIEKVNLVAHDAGHVVDLPSLLIFFETNLHGMTSDAAIRTLPKNGIDLRPKPD